MKIELSAQQKQALSQNQQQALHMLQLSSQELQTYMDRLALENPLIEVIPPEELPVPASGTDTCCGKGLSADDLEFLRNFSGDETLSDHITDQILGAGYSEKIIKQLKWLAQDLDFRGYLPEYQDGGCPPGWKMEEYENAVALLQSMEPAGVAARSLSECLCIQLRRLGKNDELLYTLCEKHLDELGRGRFNLLSRELDIPVCRIRDARDVISALNPFPGNGFNTGDTVPYVFPDVEVTVENRLPKVYAAENLMPGYRLDAEYLGMSQNPGIDWECRDYLNEKLLEAKWALNCIDRRKQTVLLCASAIVLHQKEWFLDDNAAIKPMTMTSLARELKIHTSTLSRAVSGKYLLCRRGVFPLSKFFRREFSESRGITGDSVLSLIKELIAGEDSLHPYSDMELAEELKKYNLEISRRTVAKYREDAMIPSAYVRKKNTAYGSKTE